MVRGIILEVLFYQVLEPGLCTGLLKFYLYTIKCFEERKIDGKMLCNGVKIRIVVVFLYFFVLF